MDIVVVHKHSPKRTGYKRVYVGRPTPLGNPFKVKPHGPYERDETIKLYRRWLAERVLGDVDTPQRRMLQALAAETQPLELACWCAPRACHADVIKSAIEHERTQEQ